MFVVSPEGRIARVDILEFREPPEFRASPRWLGQLMGRGLDDALSLKGSVVNLTGATLTSLPPLAIFIFLGRYFVSGLMAGTLK